MAFDVAADAYDAFMGVWSKPLATLFAEFAGVESGMRLLDVGSGPGSLTGELVRRLGPGHVAAVDPSARFVAAVADRYPGVDACRARAEALPYAAASFDGALAQLVVHFMTDPIAGLREMSRVVRQGGLVAACVWDFGGGRGPLGPFWEAARELDPDVVDESQLAGVRAGHLRELLQTAGLVEVTERELAVDRAFAGFDAWWAPFMDGVGPAGAYAVGIDPGRQAALRDRCRALLPTGSFTLRASAWAAKGRVPGSPERGSSNTSRLLG
jgi:SAM-dependent methyltransferase